MSNASKLGKTTGSLVKQAALWDKLLRSGELSSASIKRLLGSMVSQKEYNLRSGQLGKGWLDDWLHQFSTKNQPWKPTPYDIAGQDDIISQLRQLQKAPAKRPVDLGPGMYPSK